MSHLWERQEVHKSSKCIEIVVTLFAEYCQTVTTLSNLQKKLARALKDAAAVKGTGMVPANAMQASAALFEALGEVDGKLAKLAEKEYDGVSSEVRKHFKKMAKEEKAHDELTFNTNVRLKQASSSYDKKVKGKAPYTAEEHAKHVHLLSTLGNDMAAAKLAHETLVSQRHIATLFAVGASLARVADACWTGACENVRRAGPHVGRIGQWRSLCEGGWAASVPDDLPDIDKPGSAVIEKDKAGSHRKEVHYPASVSTNMTGTTTTTGTSITATSTTGTSTDGRSTPLMSPFPPTPGLGGYFNQDFGDLKPPVPPFAQHGGSSAPTTPRLGSPAPIGASLTSPPGMQRKDSAQFPPPPQHPASPTRPHVGLPSSSPVRSSVPLPDNHDGMPPPASPTRPFAPLAEAPPSPVRAPASPVRGLPSPSRTPVPASAPAQISSPGPARERGWTVSSWTPAANSGDAPREGSNEEKAPDPPVSISRFLNENKEMGIDLPALEGTAVRESVEKMVAAAREASEGSGKPENWEKNSQSMNGSQFETGPTGTLKKLVLEDDRRIPRPLSSAEGERRPLPVPIESSKPLRKRAGSIESLTSSSSTSRVAAMRSRYDNPGVTPLSPTRERPPIPDSINAARAAEPQQIRGGGNVWPRRQAAPPTSFQPQHRPGGVVSPSLDGWSAQREQDWRQREYALNLEQRELELERARLALHREHHQMAQLTGSGASKSTTDVSSTIAVSHPPPSFGRRARSPGSIPDDTRPPWVSKSNTNTTTSRYTTTLRDESDAESSSPSGKEKKSTWMGRGLRRLSMPAPFAEKKTIQVVSIPAPNREGISNRRSFEARQ